MNQQPAPPEPSATPGPVTDIGNCAQGPPAATDGQFCVSVVDPNADASRRTGMPEAPRKNYKSCEFCARRKRRCDGDGVRRCSFCIAKNQPECIYRQKPPSKAKPVSQQRRRTSGITSTKRPAERASFSMGDMLVTRSPCDEVQPQYGTVIMPRFPLKRCRLSASPATGLVGMQENTFLDDYFGCLGLLPLASESTIRQAMVKLMMARVAPSAHVQQYGIQQSVLSPFGFGCSGGLGASAAANMGGDETMAFGAPICRPTSRSDDPNDTSKCIMWCAIGLGALAQGAPVEKVTGYVELARASLAEFFDDSTVETARAYIAMALLYAFLGEGYMNRKYLAFATNIVRHLPTETVPEGINNMLLASVKSGCMWDSSDSISGMELQARLLPKQAEIIHTKDLCNMLLVNDFRLSKAFAEDMSAQGIVVDDEGEERQEEHGRDWVRETVLDATSLMQPNLKAPTSGVTMKNFVRESMPELLRLSRVAVGSGATSGVGGLFYHGNLAYMKVVEGDKFQAFANIFHCAKVLLRYPGVCRFRPHLTHCLLASSAAAYRPIYDQVRDIYNTVRPPGFRPAPPIEEWTGMSAICDHIFCRSVQAEIKDYNCVWDGTDAPEPIPSSKWSSCTDSSCGVDGERSSSPPPPTTNLYPGKDSKSSELSVPTSVTMIDSSLVCSPNGTLSEATVGQTGMWTGVEAGMQPAAATEPLVTASTTPTPASPALPATFISPVNASDASVSAPVARAGGKGMPVTEVADGGINGVGASTAAATAGVLQRVSPQPLDQYEVAKNEAETGVVIDTRGFPAGESGAAIDPHFGASTSASTSASTWAQSSASSAPLLAFCDGVGVDDAGFDLGATDEDLMEVANILLSEGLFEGEPAIQNAE